MSPNREIPFFNIQDQGDYIAVVKPHGMNTHQSDQGDLGAVEYAQMQWGQKLYIASRLDRGTSGILVFGKSSQAARELSETLGKQEVRKQYLFLSDRGPEPGSSTPLSCRVFINQKVYPPVIEFGPLENSFTEFLFLQNCGKYFLWQAIPHTGKTHQIRLHAQQLGIPILGDKVHGGSPFPRLALHCQSFQFSTKNKQYHFTSPEPFFVDPKTHSFYEHLVDIENRGFIFSEKNLIGDSSLRLIHNPNLHFRLDKFGQVLWAYWYGNTTPVESELHGLTTISDRLGLPVWIRMMRNRGTNPSRSELISIGNPPTHWTCRENGIQFSMRSDQGLSPGLFLDQRENRLQIESLANEKSVLNLFSYTGGFSLFAARGGAKEVVSVDLNKNFVEWNRGNFLLNGFDPSAYEFYKADVFDFLKLTRKKGRKFDMIICDPPTLARMTSNTFSFAKDYLKLVGDCLDLLDEKGTLFLSTNCETITAEEIENKIQTQFKMQVNKGRSGLDFDASGSDLQLKSFFISSR